MFVSPQIPHSWFFTSIIFVLFLLMFLLKRKSSDMICYHRQEDITPSYKIFTGRADAESEAPILWPPDAKSWLIGRLWCLESLKAKGEGGGRGWDGWMVSLTRWIWVRASSRSWWWTRKLGVLQPMELQRVKYDWVTELNWKPGIHSWVLLTQGSNAPFPLPLSSFL